MSYGPIAGKRPHYQFVLRHLAVDRVIRDSEAHPEGGVARPPHYPHNFGAAVQNDIFLQRRPLLVSRNNQFTLDLVAQGEHGLGEAEEAFTAQVFRLRLDPRTAADDA